MRTRLADIGDIEYEAKREGVLEIAFDTNGMTDQCPERWHCVTFDECQHCPFYIDYNGFTVYCGWRATYG